MLRFSLFLFLLNLPFASAGFSESINCSRVERLAQEASRLRGLPIRKEIGCIELDKKAYPESLFEVYYQNSSAERLQQEGKVFRLVGLIDPKFDYSGCIVGGSMKSVVGYYHPTQKSIVVPNWYRLPEEILLHELVHALQDQHFNLSALEKTAFRSTDTTIAYSALIEGDAVSVEGKFTKKEPSASTDNIPAMLEIDAQCELPETLNQLYAFPYFYGTRFIDERVKMDGPEVVNRLFKTVPQTTKEILNVKRYPKGFKKQSRLPIPPLPNGFPGYKLTYNDVIGQYAIQALLKEYVGMTQSVDATRGWITDRVGLYEKTSTKTAIVVWESAWETDAHADNFRRAYIESLTKRLSLTLSKEVRYLVAKSEELSVSLEQRNSFLRIIFAELS